MALAKATVLCYKTATKPDLKRVADYFRIPLPKARPEVLLLRPVHLESALMTDASDKSAWYYSFGCICLVNFEATEAYRLINIIESTGEEVDYRRFFSRVEREDLVLDPGLNEEEWLRLIGICCDVLAKSVELKHMEDTVNDIFDQAESFILDLQRGFSNPASRLLQEITVKIVRFQLDVVNNLRILDRPKGFEDSIDARRIYDKASQGHDLEKRFTTVQLKINDLMELISPYRKIGYSQKERRLLISEIILITLFPLAYMVKHFLLG